MTASPPVKTILILAANPKGTTPLRLDEEVREIEAGLRRAQQRDRFVLKQRWATRSLDIQRAILDENPQIVHFCGHGAGAEGLVLEDEAGRAKPVSGKALAGLFKLLAEQVDCVLLNACHSQVQAKAIARHIETVIGMSQAMGDGAAIQFAISFYDALGAGRDMAFAYQWGCAAIEMAGIDESLTPVLLRSNQDDRDPVAKASIFISYKRDVDPDETVALALHRALSQQHQVAIDQSMQVGTKWLAWIDAQIRQSDFLIVLLSEQSVRSEMVILEIEKAHQLAQRTGRPVILPVRLTYRQPFEYPLNVYLDSLQWAIWQGTDQTAQLIDQLQRAIAGRHLPLDTAAAKAELLQDAKPDSLPYPTPMAHPQRQSTACPIRLERPEGTMTVESRFYLERPEDQIALETIQEEGVTLTIKGARQMGKSSLLIRVMDQAVQAGKQVAFLDFQMFDKTTLHNADEFFYQFCLWLTDALALEERVADYWQRQSGNRQRCSRYVQREILPTLEKSLVLAMDEVESIFDAPFRTDFFGMLRGWHNQRAMSPLWKRLDLALVTSTEPYQLIDSNYKFK